MQLNSASGTFIRRPGKQGQADINDGRIHCIKCAFQIHAEVYIFVKWYRLLNQMLSEVRIDPPVPRFIGISQSGPLNRRSKPCVVESRAMRGKTDFDIAKTFPTSKLREDHSQELFP